MNRIDLTSNYFNGQTDSVSIIMENLTNYDINSRADDDLLNIPPEHPDYLHYQDFKDPIKHFIEINLDVLGALIIDHVHYHFILCVQYNVP